MCPDPLPGSIPPVNAVRTMPGPSVVTRKPCVGASRCVWRTSTAAPEACLPPPGTGCGATLVLPPPLYVADPHCGRRCEPVGLAAAAGAAVVPAASSPANAAAGSMPLPAPTTVPATGSSSGAPSSAPSCRLPATAVLLRAGAGCSSCKWRSAPASSSSSAAHRCRSWSLARTRRAASARRAVTSAISALSCVRREEGQAVVGTSVNQFKGGERGRCLRRGAGVQPLASKNQSHLGPPCTLQASEHTVKLLCTRRNPQAAMHPCTSVRTCALALGGRGPARR